MKYFLFKTLGLCTLTLTLHAALDNTTCKRCHPKIFNEYQNSMHRKASIYNDKVHKAVWDKHPAKQKGNYQCAKCHSPSDKALLQTKGIPQETPKQLQEPISCQTCHTIESVEKHARSNTNVYTKKSKTFFSADKDKKGEKLVFHEEKSFLGLFRKTVGSPYHDIDYSNENYYNGNACMGCHERKENAKGFAVCDMEVKAQKETQENCITCHMPQVKGSFASQKESKTHAYHGSNIVTASPAMLEKYIHISLEKNEKGFEITLQNKANHTLFPHPLRIAVLKTVIKRGDKMIPLEEKQFARIIGTNGKPSSPWLADTVIKDTSIKAYEARKISYNTPLQKGDQVFIEFGYHIVNPKMAEKLGIHDQKYTKFILFKRKNFTF